MELDDGLQSIRPSKGTPGNGDAAALALTAGTKVGMGRYTLERELGRGGMGVVWLAHDTALNDRVALKFLPPEIRRDASALDDLKRETMKSRKLTHPNIIRIHDFCQFEDELPFISMEFVEGTTLSSLKVKEEARCFQWDALKVWASQLCAALDYAHGEGVVHRDLKPGNIMLDGRGRLKLADFGLAATISDSMGRVSMNMGNSGTPSYMSPQQMDGRPPKATDDIYALGATFYELLTSKPPFYSGDIAHQVRNLSPDTIEQRLADLEIENAVPGDVAALLMACLSKDAARRPQSAAAVAEFVGLNVSSKPVGTSALAAESSSRDTSALEDEPPSQAETDYSEAASEPAASGGGMPRWVWGAVAAGVAVLAVVIGVVVMGNKKKDGGTTQSIAAAPKAANQSAATSSISTPVAATMQAATGIPLFNGKDLQGWDTNTSGGAWRVAGGSMVGDLAVQASYRGIHTTGKPEADFRLRFSSRFGGPPNNDLLVLGLRHDISTSAAERVQYKLVLSADGKASFTKQIGVPLVATCNSGDKLTIRLVGPSGEAGTAAAAFPAGRLNPAFKSGDWTAWEVIASNFTFTVFCNNQPVLQLIDEGQKRQREGVTMFHIGTRVSPAQKVELKDLSIQPLETATAAAALVTSLAPVPLPTVDASFNPNGGADRQISQIVNAPGGKFIIFGGFKSYDGKPRPGVARLNANGSLDETFSPQTALPVASVLSTYRGAVQADGRVLLPLIRIAAGKTNHAIVRLDAVGNLDATFRPPAFTSASLPTQLALDSQGRIYCNATTLMRLRPDGSADATFQLRDVIQGSVSRLSVQKDDKVLVAGRMTRVGATPVGGFARFLPDGRLDTTFTTSPGAEAGAQFNYIEEHADGKIWVAGHFASIHGQPRKLFARLLPDGKLDMGFVPQWQPADESSSIKSPAITVQTTSAGGVLVGGQFLLGTGQNGLAHFQPNGQMDILTSKNSGGAWGGTTTPDGDLVLVGQLKTVFGSKTENIVRLKNQAAAAK